MIPGFLDAHDIPPGTTAYAGDAAPRAPAAVGIAPAMPMRCDEDGCCIRGCICANGQNCPCCKD